MQCATLGQGSNICHAPTNALLLPVALPWSVLPCLLPVWLSAALPHMTAVLQGRPPSFPSLEVACDWAVRTGTCKNREMAGVSLPSQLRQVRLNYDWTVRCVHPACCVLPTIVKQIRIHCSAA